MIEIKKEVTDQYRFLQWELGEETVNKLTFDQRVIAYACLMSGKKCYRHDALDAATEGYCNTFNGTLTPTEVVFQMVVQQGFLKEDGNVNTDCGDYFIPWLLEHVNYEKAGDEYEWWFDEDLIRVSYSDTEGDFDGVVQISNDYRYCYL